MNDIAFEWLVPYFLNGKQRLIKAVMVSAVIVFLFDDVFFASGMLIAAAVLAVFGFFLFRSWKYEYEYEYVNGDLTVSKIIRKEKRKEVYRIDRREIEDFKNERISEPGCKFLDFTSGRPGAPVCTIRAKGSLVYVEPSGEFLREMEKYYRMAGV